MFQTPVLIIITQLPNFPISYMSNKGNAIGFWNSKIATIKNLTCINNGSKAVLNIHNIRVSCLITFDEISKTCNKGKIGEIKLRYAEEELHQLDEVVPDQAADQAADQALADPPAKENKYHSYFMNNNKWNIM